MESITIENEKSFLKTTYPMISFGGKTVRYDPQRHELEAGEAAYYLDIASGTVRAGIIDGVQRSIPMNYPIYAIGDETVMYHRVWPNVEGQKILDRLNAEKGKRLAEIMKEEIAALSPCERQLLGM